MERQAPEETARPASVRYRPPAHNETNHEREPVSASVLIVDDDAELSGMLVRLLKGEGWAAHSALTALEGERLLALHQPAVVILDVMLPDDNGINVCRRWRVEHPALGILMLSARGEPMDKVLGLEVGADDYLAKPFERRELIARVRALLRRQQPGPAAAAGQLALGGLDIDLLRREVWADGQAVALTSIEFKLLLVMARRPGQTLTRHLLSDTAQPGNYRPLDRTVDVQVGRLRRKLQQASPGHEWITTVRGEGYMLTPRTTEAPSAVASSLSLSPSASAPGPGPAGPPVPSPAPLPGPSPSASSTAPPPLPSGDETPPL